MKLSKADKVFQPATIVLENEAELSAMQEIMRGLKDDGTYSTQSTCGRIVIMIDDFVSKALDD